MEPITTTVMISGIVGYLAKTIKDNKSVQDFFKDFTTASVGWLRPLFLKGGENEYEKVIADLLKNPESSIKQDQVKTAIASHLEDSPTDEAFLKEMYEALQAKAGRGEGISIVNSKNVNTGIVNTGGGDFILGDGNTRR